MRIGALISGGKDSLYAMYLARQKGHEISCLIAMHSENPDSYMFHTPALNVVELQAKSLGLPLIEGKTKGEEEKELDDLADLLSKAKKKFKIEGVTTGALFSNYQKARIERVCAEIGLHVINPLWHMDQEKEFKGLLDAGFNIIFTAVAAEGVNEKWLGREIDYDDLGVLKKLNMKYGINVAGEGGEFESLVIDCPMFTKKLEILETKVVKTGAKAWKLIVEKAKLKVK